MNFQKACVPPSVLNKMSSSEIANGQQAGKMLDFSEYKVRLPRNVSKSYNIMRFNVPVDISSIEEATMERQYPLGEEKEAKAAQNFGAGTEYGAGRREEARKRRRGIIEKKTSREDLPWTLTVGRKKKAKRYVGNKEKETTANASYFVFTQCPDGAFEAFPVDSFYRYSAAINYQTLNSEEAEEQFAQRHKILNYHSLMIKKKLEKVKDESDKEVEGEEKKDNVKQNSLDDENWMSDSSNGDDEDDEQNEKKDSKAAPKKKNQGEKNTKSKKSGKSSDSDNESEEDGFMDSKELDYSSESSEEEEEKEKEKETVNNKESTQDDLNTHMGTESEDDEEEDEDLTKSGKELKAMLKREEGGGETSDEEEDFDEDEETYSKSAILQGKRKKKNKSGSPSSTSSSSRSSTPTIDTTTTTIAAAAKKLTEGTPSKSRKRPSSKGPGTDSPVTKKSKINNSTVTSTPPLSTSGTNSPVPSDGPSHGITEDAIRRYLSRKPMTTKDLLQKFKTKRTGLTSEQTVQHIGNILRKISPEQKRIDGKLYLTLKSS